MGKNIKEKYIDIRDFKNHLLESSKATPVLLLRKNYKVIFNIL